MPCASVPCPAAVPAPGASKVIVFCAAARPVARSSTLISLQNCRSLITFSSLDLNSSLCTFRLTRSSLGSRTLAGKAPAFQTERTSGEQPS
jgi:hypothetical protein